MNPLLAKVPDLAVNDSVANANAEADDTKDTFAFLRIQISPLVLFFVTCILASTEFSEFFRHCVHTLQQDDMHLSFL